MAMYLGDKPVKAVLCLLPAEYQEVEYIESTGTQYIDTGVNADYNSRIYAKTNYANNNLIAVEDTSVSEKCIAITGASDIEHFRFLQPSGTQFFGTASLYGVYEIELSNSKSTAYFDDGTKREAYIRNSANVSIDLPFFIFARNSNGTAKNYTARKLYSLKLWNGDNLVRDYIPCYRKSDNEIGLYDLVNKEFYTNNGTGTFLKGKNKTTVRYFTAPIKKCTGNNLFDVSKLINTTVDGDYFIGAGAGKSFYNLRVTPLRTYTVTYTVKTGNDGVGAQLLMAVVTGKDNGYYGNGKRIVITLKPRGGEYSVTNKFTVPENVTWVSFSSISHLFRTDNFMINEGSTALPYEPYTEWYEY